MQPNRLPLGTLLLFSLFLLVLLATYLVVKPPSPPPELAAVLRSEYRPITPFRLLDHNQQPFDEKRLRGQWSLLFFGYLSCPDVCPLTLHELNQMWRGLHDETGAPPADLQVLFVSVDPARDSPQRLGEYVRHFNPAFIAATAETEQLDRLTSQLGVGYMIDEETAPGQYLVAHTSAIFLVDPLGRSVAIFSQPHYAATLQAQYQRIVDYFNAAG